MRLEARHKSDIVGYQGIWRIAVSIFTFLATGLVAFVWFGCDQSKPPTPKTDRNNKNIVEKAARTEEENQTKSSDNIPDPSSTFEESLGKTSPEGSTGNTQPPNGNESSGPGSSTSTNTTSGTPPPPAGDPKAPPTPTPPPPPPPAGPQPTHKLTVDCKGGLNIAFAFGGRVQPYFMSSGSINGQPTELETTYCPKIKPLLDQKGLPTGKTLSQPTGGAGLRAACASGTLTLNYVSGNPNGGTGIALSSGVDTESPEVCLEVRNIINGLKLEMAAPI
jgi:hypothetical protein